MMSCEVNEKWAADTEGKELAGVTQNLCVNVIKLPEHRRVPNFTPFLSTNTYYGYIPVYGSDNCQMDTDDVNTWTKADVNSHFARQGDCVSTLSGSRKRTNRDMLKYEEGVKKCRREEAVSKCEKDCDRNIFQESEMELEKLLKYTHGCEIYNYYSACDI